MGVISVPANVFFINQPFWGISLQHWVSGTPFSPYADTSGPLTGRLVALGTGGMRLTQLDRSGHRRCFCPHSAAWSNLASLGRLWALCFLSTGCTKQPSQKKKNQPKKCSSFTARVTTPAPLLSELPLAPREGHPAHLFSWAAAKTEKFCAPRETWRIPQIHFAAAKSSPKDHLSHATGSRGRGGDLPPHLALQHRCQSHSCKPSGKGSAASGTHVALTGQEIKVGTFLPLAYIWWIVFPFRAHLGPLCSPLPAAAPNSEAEKALPTHEKKYMVGSQLSVWGKPAAGCRSVPFIFAPALVAVPGEQRARPDAPKPRHRPVSPTWRNPCASLETQGLLPPSHTMLVKVSGVSAAEHFKCLFFPSGITGWQQKNWNKSHKSIRIYPGSNKGWILFPNVFHREYLSFWSFLELTFYNYGGFVSKKWKFSSEMMFLDEGGLV